MQAICFKLIMPECATDIKERQISIILSTSNQNILTITKYLLCKIIGINYIL